MGNIVLPDFDDVLALAETIKHLMVDKAVNELKIEEAESKVYQEAASNPKYFVGGKSPSNAHVKSVYIYGGLDGELIPLRQTYAVVCAELEFSKIKFDIFKMQIDLYRTESANKRTVAM